MNQADVPISGTFIVRGTVSGTTTRPMASIKVQGSNLVAYEEQVGSLNADVRLDGRELTLSELVVDKPQPDKPGRVMATGTYNLDRKTYTFDLQSQDLQLLSLVMPGGQQVRGNVQKLAAAGSGSVNSPEGTVDLDVDALETNATPGRARHGQRGGEEQRGHDHRVCRSLQPRRQCARRPDETVAHHPQGARRQSRSGCSSRSGVTDVGGDAALWPAGPAARHHRRVWQSDRAGKGQSHGGTRVARRHLERPAVHRHEPEPDSVRRRTAGGRETRSRGQRCLAHRDR